MKKISLLILILIFALPAFSQESYTDLIYLYDGTIINAKVLKQNLGKSITYKTESGSITNIRWDDIQKYYIDNKLTTTEDIDPEILKKKSYLEKGYNEYAAFGLGLGNAYGGLGVHLQIRGGKTIGFGGHFGVGFIPGINGWDKSFGWNIGGKIYCYRYLFIDVTYGVVAVYNDGQTGIGPSLLTGGDFIFSKNIGLNIAIGGSKYGGEIGPTFDFGLLIKLSPQKTKKSDHDEIN